MDASEIYSERLNAKEVIFPKENGKFYFPAADGRIKLPGGDQGLRTSTLIREHPNRGEGHVDFLGESEGSLPPPQDSLPDAGEAINDFWSMSGNFIYCHHVEPRVKLYSSREESFTHQRWKRVRNKHQFRIRDATQDRQPEIQSSLVRDDFQRIMEQTNNDCRFRILILTNSLHQPRLLSGR